MAIDLLAENDTYVSMLSRLITKGEMGLAEAPEVLRKVLTEGRWRERKISLGRVVKFSRFEEFVTTKPIDGLGTTMDMVIRIAGKDGELLKAITQATKRTVGRPAKEQTEIVDNIHNLERPDGTSSLRAHRRLSDQAPELHARVLAGELSPHAAMVEAGFRRRTITIPIEAERAARAIQRHFSDESIRELVAILSTPN